MSLYSYRVVCSCYVLQIIALHLPACPHCTVYMFQHAVDVQVICIGRVVWHGGPMFRQTGTLTLNK